MQRLFTGTAALLALCVPVQAGPHPFYDDGGNINWRPTFQQALALAQQTGRPIFCTACKEKEPKHEEFVTTTLRDPALGKLINRYFVPVVITFDKPPATLQRQFADADPKVPYIMFLSNRGQYRRGLRGSFRAPNLLEDAHEVLKKEKYVVPAAQERLLASQVQALQKAVDKKSWSRAGLIFTGINRLRGYSAEKDKAYDIMEAAQADATKLVDQAYTLVRSDKYTEASKLLQKVTQSHKGLPVAIKAKQHMAAVKLLAYAKKLVSDKTMNRKRSAILQLDKVIRYYNETPYGKLAAIRKKEILESK